MAEFAPLLVLAMLTAMAAAPAPAHLLALLRLTRP
jgi:hypothetical protein